MRERVGFMPVLQILALGHNEGRCSRDERLRSNLAEAEERATELLCNNAEAAIFET